MLGLQAAQKDNGVCVDTKPPSAPFLSRSVFISFRFYLVPFLSRTV
jgi:hypothetical protein